jgi:protein SCO1/2
VAVRWRSFYTQCPDICPTTLLQLSEDLQRFGPDADRISVLFVSLDPERDTPDVLLSYMASFDPRIVARTGAAATIAAVARAYGAHYRKVTTDQGYTIEHTAAMLLLDRDGEYVGAITYAESADVQIDDLRCLLP